MTLMNDGMQHMYCKCKEKTAGILSKIFIPFLLILILI